MKKSSSCAWFLATTALFIAGCGETPPGLPLGPELTVDERMAVLDAATDELNTLIGKGRDEIGQEMLDWAKSRPEFRESGLTDEGDIWATYNDGQLFLVPNNREFTAADLGEPDGTNKPKRDPRTEKTLELPSTLNARLASVYGQHITSHVDVLGAWLGDAGYNVALAHDLNVEGFRSINGAHSVVYFDSHGIRLSPNSDYNPNAHHRFLLSTNTYLTRSALATYQDEIRSGALVPIPAYFGFVTPGGGLTVRAKPTLCITAKFVRENMKFAPDSFVFVNACSSYSTDFRDACFEAGASVYAGWSQPVFNGEAVNVASLLFDRMLGGNRHRPPTPRRSARTWVAVYDEMKRDGTDTYGGSKGQTQIILAENPNSNGGDFAEFSPSIHGRMRVDEEKGHLIIQGFFGQRPGKVTINGTELELVGEWGATELTCRIPTSGANAAGDVQVWVDGRPSNRAQLTMWEGTFNLMSHAAGSLMTTAELNVRLRGDVRYDLTPDAQSPSASTIAQWKANRDSTCKVNALGEHAEGSTTTTFALSGSSEVPLNRGFHDPANPDYVYWGDLVPAERTLYFHFEIRAVGKNLSTITFSGSPPITTPMIIGFWSSQFYEGVQPHKYKVPLLFGGDYTIVGGSQDAQDGAANALTLTWAAMAAQHPPDTTQGR